MEATVTSEIQRNKKPKKNSNAIKKMGRIILNQLEEYQLQGQAN
jgi:hypothetical protein